MDRKKRIYIVLAVLIAVSLVVILFLTRQPSEISNVALESDIIWRGDAETGDLSQWCNAHQAAPGRISVVTSPVVQGGYAYKFILNNGDSVFGTERVVLNQANPECANTKWETGERYYGWSVMLPADFPINSAWSLVAQWKGVHTGSPVIQLGLANDKWRLLYRPTTSSPNILKWETPVKKGQYESFVMHVNYSTDPQVGFIELWMNGVLVVPKFYTSTIHLSGGVPAQIFVEIGLYRDSGISSNVVLFHDGFTVGKTYASVKGNVASTPVATLPPTLIPPTVTKIPPTSTPQPVTPVSPTPLACVDNKPALRVIIEQLKVIVVALEELAK